MGRQTQRTGASIELDGGRAIMDGCLAANRIERCNRGLDYGAARAGERELTAFMKRQPKDVRAALLMAQYALLLTSPAKANSHLSVAFAAEAQEPVRAERNSAVL